MTSATGVFLFHQLLLEKTSGQVKKDAIIFSNVFLFLAYPVLALRRSSPRLTVLPQPVRNLLVLALPSVSAPVRRVKV